MAAAAGIAGAAQLALIQAQPLPQIPQFFKGTDSAPDGIISVAEKGRELAITKEGKPILFDRPTITEGLGGARILPNAETEAMLMNVGLKGDASSMIGKKLDKLTAVISNSKSDIVIHNNVPNINIDHYRKKYKRHN